MNRLRKCLCGCGSHVRHPGRKFISGHNAKLESHRAMMRILKKENCFFAGRRHTVEAKNKISRANIGRRHTAIAKAKIGIKRSNCILPKVDTSIEIAIQQQLVKADILFSKHKTFKSLGFTINGLGCSRLLGHQADIILPKYKLIIECDGDYWHNYPHGTVKDIYLDKIVKANGWKILRFWGSEIKKNPEACLNEIQSYVKSHCACS